MSSSSEKRRHNAPSSSSSAKNTQNDNHSVSVTELSAALAAQRRRRELDNEWHLMSKIKELNKQLEAERSRMRKDAKNQERKARLIVAANRLPVTPTRDVNGEWSLKRSSGGLVSAFLGVKHYSITWVGWVGCHVSEADRPTVTRMLAECQPFRCYPVYLDEETAELYYNGFSNNILWPLLHYIPLSMLDSQSDAAELQWKAYQAANRAFADAVLQLQPTEHDYVWVQDYHLMLVPKCLRDLSPRLSIGWFLHTPFATSEMYRTLPHREEILRGVLGADLCGFHIYDYAQHFNNACGRVLGIGGESGVTQGNDGIFDHLARRSTNVDAFPIGISPQRFERALASPGVKDKIIDLQRRFDGKKVLLGIDRLDYVKGIPHKLKALEYFLQTFPAWRGKVVLLQIAVPSRTEVTGYQKLRSNVHELVSRINGTFGSLEDVPIHYLDQSMSFPELCALYFRADIMLVTSLRDGMNLVSFEYIACQRSRDELTGKGVLVLSEFAGAAQALGAGALLVNPYNVVELGRALDEGLNMSAKEREERFSYLDSHIHMHTAQVWADEFVSSLRDACQSRSYDVGPFSELTEAKDLPISEVVTSYEACERLGGRRLLVFGLLGTLIDYAAFKNLGGLPPSVRRNLAALAASPNNTIIVCSGRERALMNEWLGDLPIWLVAENGLWIRPPPDDASTPAEQSSWMLEKDDLDNDWMAPLKPVFRYFEARTPDTLTEVQERTMTWHFQEADDEFADVQAVALQQHLVKVSGNEPVEVGLDRKRVEVRPYGVSKGNAILRILELIAKKHRRNHASSSGEEEALAAAAAAATREMDRVGTPKSSGERTPQQHGAGAAASPGGAASQRLGATATQGVPTSFLLTPPAASGSSSFEQGAPAAPTLVDEPPFDWVFAMSEVMARDEDLFSSLRGLAQRDGAIEAEADSLAATSAGRRTPLLSEGSGSTSVQRLPSPAAAQPGGGDKDFDALFSTNVSGYFSKGQRDLSRGSFGSLSAGFTSRDSRLDSLSEGMPLEDPPFNLSSLRVYTCCVGKTLSQAEYSIGDEAAGLLDLLANASCDASSRLGDAPIKPQLPSVLERLPQLTRELVGRQLLFLLDYNDCPLKSGGPIADGGDSAAATVHAKLASLYPTAVVLRSEWSESSPADETESHAAGVGGGGTSAGEVSGVLLLPFARVPGAPSIVASSTGAAAAAADKPETVDYDFSYRPALESCLTKLSERVRLLGIDENVANIEDNSFSLSVHCRGASDSEQRHVRDAVSETLEREFPMLRLVEGRTVLEIRPEVEWNRHKAVEWLNKTVVERVVDRVGLRGMTPVYIGGDPAFQSIRDVNGGVHILVTGGPSGLAYFLRDASQVGQLLRFFVEQHAAGITVRGGKLRQPAGGGGGNRPIIGQRPMGDRRLQNKFITSGPKLSERHSAADGGEGRDGSSGGVPVLLPQHSV